jgi:hypothetical protein
MFHLLSAILLLSLQAAPTPAAAPQGATPAPPAAPATAQARPDPADAPDEMTPPPGTPEELKLWLAGVEANKSIVQVRAAAGLLQTRARGADLLPRLEAAGAKIPHEEAEKLHAQHKRLKAAWDKNRELFARRWPVDPTRACGYPHLNYDSAMRLPPGPSRRAEVENARTELKTCVDRAGLVTSAMAAANVAFDAAINDALKALAKAEARPPSGDRDDEHERHERHEAHERSEGK